LLVNHPGHPEITNDFAFATAMANADKDLDEARTKANATDEDARKAQNLSKKVLDELEKAAPLAGNDLRREALRERNTTASATKNAADKRLIELSQDRAFLADKAAAEAAERSDHWDQASNLWQAMPAKYPGHPEISNQLALAKAIARADKTLSEATNKATGNEADLRDAQDLCKQVLAELEAVAALAASTGRQVLFDNRKTKATTIAREAESRMAEFKRENEFRLAKTIAEEAERTNAWPLASNLWAKLQTPEHPEVKDNVAFVSAMLAGNRFLTADEPDKAQGEATKAMRLRPNSPAAKNLSRETTQIIENRDYLIATNLFKNCKFQEASDRCTNHLQSARFPELKRQIDDASATFQTMTLAFPKGDYDSVLNSAYRTNACFDEFVGRANNRKAKLRELQPLKDAHNWGKLREELLKLDPSILKEKPFDDLFTLVGQVEQNELRAQDDRLVDLADKFNENVPDKLRKPGSKHGSALTDVTLQDKDRFTNEANQLEAYYKKNNYLELDGRGKLLQKIKLAIERY